ncbi:DUF6427 family protein [Cytophagaceae bacterium ABcell3]|nr:DUF6427 family protein [Cytophagaceae bacterium ABcell3]
MISYFRNYGFSRLPVLFIILLLLRLPMFFAGIPLTIPELTWLTVGEKVANGFVMYRDVWENLEPLSVAVYHTIHLLFGKSETAYRIIALFLVFVQAYFLNEIYNMQQAREKTTLPALFYIIFSFLYFDFLTLSPMLMGLTFILVMLYYVFYLMRSPEDYEKVLYLGLSAGMAMMFYYPAAVFFIFIFLTLVIYTPANLAKVLLLLSGFLLPMAIAAVYFFWFDGLRDFYHNFIITPFSLQRFRYVENETLILVFAVPLLVTVLSFFVSTGAGGKTNYQTNVIKVTFLYLILAAVAFVFFTRTITTNQLYIFLPGIVIYTAFAMQQLRNRRLQEFSFWFTVFLVVLVSYGSLYDFAVRSDLADNDHLIADREALHEHFTGKNVWTTGDDRDIYLDNTLGMPYLNMVLAERHFNRLHSFQVLSEVYENFIRHRPEVIDDQGGLMPDIFMRIPVLENEYKQWAEDERVYIRTDLEID